MQAIEHFASQSTISLPIDILPKSPAESTDSLHQLPQPLLPRDPGTHRAAQLAMHIQQPRPNRPLTLHSQQSPASPARFAG